MKKPWLTILGLTAFMAAVPAGLIFVDNTNREYRERTQTGLTQAKITAVDMDNHATAYFEFVVGDKTYTSSSSGWGSIVKSGDLVILHYNPNEPTQASLGEYEEPMSYSVLWVTSAIALVISWTYYLIIVRSRAAHSS